MGGKHKAGNVLLGGMASPHRKAVTIVTAAVYAGNGEPISQTDMLWIGVETIAKQLGILDKDGNVTPAYKDAVTVAEALVRENHKNNKGSRGGRRKGSPK